MLKKSAVSAALAVAGLVLAVAPTAWAHERHAQTLWASPNGGAGACTHWAPCSLQNAVSTANAGTT